MILVCRMRTVKNEKRVFCVCSSIGSICRMEYNINRIKQISISHYVEFLARNVRTYFFSFLFHLLFLKFFTLHYYSALLSVWCRAHNRCSVSRTAFYSHVYLPEWFFFSMSEFNIQFAFGSISMMLCQFEKKKKKKSCESTHSR